MKHVSAHRELCYSKIYYVLMGFWEECVEPDGSARFLSILKGSYLKTEFNWLCW